LTTRYYITDPIKKLNAYRRKIGRNNSEINHPMMRERERDRESKCVHRM
jgi:hypothetical protein